MHAQVRLLNSLPLTVPLPLSPLATNTPAASAHLSLCPAGRPGTLHVVQPCGWAAQLPGPG